MMKSGSQMMKSGSQMMKSSSQMMKNEMFCYQTNKAKFNKQKREVTMDNGNIYNI